jgi:hypothetical protein
MMPLLVNFFTTHVIFITKRFGYGVHLVPRIVDNMYNDVLEDLMVFCLVLLSYHTEIALHLIM